MNSSTSRNIKLFNSPIEMGFRSLFILSEIYPKTCDLQRLIYFDYLLVHSNDIDPESTSLHPSLPNRSSEIFVKRDLLQNGLRLMCSKELVQVIFDETGINYSTTLITKPFIESCESEYSKALLNKAKWVVSKFSNYSQEELSQLINNKIGEWGSEFSKEAFMLEEDFND